FHNNDRDRETRESLRRCHRFLHRPPDRNAFSRCRISTRQEQLQLVSFQRQTHLVAFRPPSESSLGQPHLAKPESAAFVGKDLYRLRSPVQENEQRSRKWIRFQNRPAYLRQTINAATKIRRLTRHQIRVCAVTAIIHVRSKMPGSMPPRPLLLLSALSASVR